VGGEGGRGEREWERGLTTDSERQELLSMWEVKEGGVRGSSLSSGCNLLL